VHDLPQLEPTDRFRVLSPLREARRAARREAATAVPGAQLAALRAAVPALRHELVTSGRPTAVATGDLV